MPNPNGKYLTRTTSHLLRLSAFLMLPATGLIFLFHSDFDLQRLFENVQDTNPLYFAALMILLPLAGFPISAFYLFAGSAYAWWQASLLCSISLAANMAIAYLLAKYFLTIPVSHFMTRYRKQLPDLTERNQFRVTFLVRSIPGIPFFMQNYMLPLLGVDFIHYFIISWSIQSIFAAGMAALPHLVKNTGWAIGGIVVGLVFLLLIFKRFYLIPPHSNTE